MVSNNKKTMQSPVSSSSVSVSRAENAFRHVNDAIKLFDQIFIEIAPVNGYNDPNVGAGVKIPQINLTDKQCNLIKEMSGHLIGIRKNVQCRSGSEPLTPAVEQRMGQDSATANLARQYNLLKDYLIAELNRSETAAHALKSKEEELVIITAERDKLKKKLANLTSNGSSSSVVNKVTTTGISTTVSSSSKNIMKKDNELHHRHDSSIDPSSYVGGFIRKPFGSSYFFGLIASYDAQAGYYQLVYEDADFEDLTFTEMKRVLWSGSTPTAKREACLKHAKLLNKLTDEECMRLTETYNSTNGLGLVLGAGRTRKPSLSLSSTISDTTTSGSRSCASSGNHANHEEVLQNSTGSIGDTKAATQEIPVVTMTDLESNCNTATSNENSRSSDIPISTSTSSSTSTQIQQQAEQSQQSGTQEDISSRIATVRAKIVSATAASSSIDAADCNTATASIGNTQQASPSLVTTTNATATASIGTSNLEFLHKLVTVNADVAPSPPAALSSVVGDSKERPKSKAKDSVAAKTVSREGSEVSSSASPLLSPSRTATSSRTTTASTTTSTAVADTARASATGIITTVTAVSIPRNALTDKVRAKNTTIPTTPTTTPSSSQVNTINDDDSDDSSVVFIGSRPSPQCNKPVARSSSKEKLQQHNDTNGAAMTASSTGKRRSEEESVYTANKKLAIRNIGVSPNTTTTNTSLTTTTEENA